MDQTPATPQPVAPQPARPRDASLPAAAGGFARAVGFVAGLFVLGVVFFAGLAIGIFMMLAGSMVESPVIPELYRDGGRATVAVIPVEGVIDPYRAESVRLLVDHTLDDSSVRAVVLRVESPGGGIAPSDQIWYQVKRLKDAGLPVVASFGGVAASGGYYVSAGTDHIVAEPTTITGSIGVIAQTFILTGLMQKVGIEPVTLLSTDSPDKDLGNPFREWTEEDHRRFTDLLDAAYEIFNQRVTEGRKDVIADAQEVDRLADGSVFTAREALDNGLVDSIGYLDDAVAAAEKQAGVPAGSSTVVILREPMGFLAEMLGARSRPGVALDDAESLRSAINDLTSVRLMYLMR